MDTITHAQLEAIIDAEFPPPPYAQTASARRSRVQRWEEYVVEAGAGPVYKERGVGAPIYRPLQVAVIKERVRGGYEQQKRNGLVETPEQAAARHKRGLATVAKFNAACPLPHGQLAGGDMPEAEAFGRTRSTALAPLSAADLIERHDAYLADGSGVGQAQPRIDLERMAELLGERKDSTTRKLVKLEESPAFQQLGLVHRVVEQVQHASGTKYVTRILLTETQALVLSQSSTTERGIQLRIQMAVVFAEYRAGKLQPAPAAPSFAQQVAHELALVKHQQLTNYSLYQELVSNQEVSKVQLADVTAQTLQNKLDFEALSNRVARIHASIAKAPPLPTPVTVAPPLPKPELVEYTRVSVNRHFDGNQLKVHHGLAYLTERGLQTPHATKKGQYELTALGRRLGGQKAHNKNRPYLVWPKSLLRDLLGVATSRSAA